MTVDTLLYLATALMNVDLPPGGVYRVPDTDWPSTHVTTIGDLAVSVTSTIFERFDPVSGTVTLMAEVNGANISEMQASYSLPLAQPDGGQYIGTRNPDTGQIQPILIPYSGSSWTVRVSVINNTDQTLGFGNEGVILGMWDRTPAAGAPPFPTPPLPTGVDFGGGGGLKGTWAKLATLNIPQSPGGVFTQLILPTVTVVNSSKGPGVAWFQCRVRSGGSGVVLPTLPVHAPLGTSTLSFSRVLPSIVSGNQGSGFCTVEIWGYSNPSGLGLSASFSDRAAASSNVALTVTN